MPTACASLLLDLRQHRRHCSCCCCYASSSWNFRQKKKTKIILIPTESLLRYTFFRHPSHFSTISASLQPLNYSGFLVYLLPSSCLLSVCCRCCRKTTNLFVIKRRQCEKKRHPHSATNKLLDAVCVCFSFFGSSVKIQRSRAYKQLKRQSYQIFHRKKRGEIINKIT